MSCPHFVNCINPELCDNGCAWTTNADGRLERPMQSGEAKAITNYAIAMMRPFTESLTLDPSGQTTAVAFAIAAAKMSGTPLIDLWLETAQLAVEKERAKNAGQR